MIESAKSDGIIAAIVLGTIVIEKHFAFDKNMEGPDRKARLDPSICIVNAKQKMRTRRGLMFLTKDTYEKNIQLLADLFEISFKRKIPTEFLRWRYLQNPTNDILACISFDGERLIANYSASPCVINMFGNPTKTALSMTTMTDPDYNGKGLFTRLATELYQFMLEKDYFMIWGFPNRNSHLNFVNRLQWQDIYEIPTMRLNLNNLLKRIDMRKSEVVTDNSFELNYSNPSKGSEGLIKTEKNQLYLQWRYLHNPVNNYVNFILHHRGIVLSFCIVKVYGKELDIVDLQAVDKDQGMVLLLTALDYAMKLELNSVNCWAPRHHFFHSLCERLGFCNKEPITYFGARLLKDCRISKIFDFSNWYLQMGDSDVY